MGILSRQLHNPKALYFMMGETLTKQHQARFKKEISPEGKKWAPLKSWYQAQKKGVGILRESGNLHNTLAYNLSNNALAFGSSRKYAATHQFGATLYPKNAKRLALKGGGFAKKVVIPARPWLGISAEDKQELQNKAAQLLARSLNRSF